jgi:hypothetical protein
VNVMPVTRRTVQSTNAELARPPARPAPAQACAGTLCNARAGTPAHRDWITECPAWLWGHCDTLTRTTGPEMGLKTVTQGRAQNLSRDYMPKVESLWTGPGGRRPWSPGGAGMTGTGIMMHGQLDYGTPSKCPAAEQPPRHSFAR